MNLSEAALLRDGDVVRAFLDATADLSQDEVAARVDGVLQNDVSRWRRGDWKRLSAKKRRALLAFLQARAGAADGSRADLPSADRLAAQMLFEHFEGMVRRMGGAEEAPEELQLRKLDVVDGLKRLHAAAGAVPGWVYELEGRIKRGEL